MANQLNIKGYDFIEFYVGSAKMWAYWLAKTMAFEIKGYSGPETGVKDKASYFLVKNKIKLVISSALKPSNYEVASFIEKHGDGVKRWSLAVENVKEAFELAVKNGGIPVRNLKRFEDENGYIEEAAIKLYDDAEIVFINRDNYKGIFRPGYGKPIQKINIKTKDSGLHGS